MEKKLFESAKELIKAILMLENEEECKALLQGFFAKKREEAQQEKSANQDI